MSAEIKILLAHDDPSVLQSIDKALDGVEYSIAEYVTTCDQLHTACYERRPDVVISAVKLQGGDAINVLVEVGYDCPVPTIIVTERDSLHDVERALQDHVMAYLLLPLDPEQIKPTIYLVLRRFEQFEALRGEVEDLRQALTDRKLIERAKGVLMAGEDIDESEAFRKLQKAAMSNRKKLAEIAQEILDSHESDVE